MVFEDKFFQHYIVHINWVGGRGVARQAKWAVVNEVGEIVMCIAVPDVHSC